ncbi:uncharacterized protein [Primulina huaijiensis]|uniref:uncharacterized protein isoform X1 n=1 Tax=Primulina huaijiensis TaxID=1492673 RepID=UPI003CC7737C
MQSTQLISKAANLLTIVRCDAGVDGSRSSQAAVTPLLSVSKPSWIVSTQSNVRIEKRKFPDPPCVVCRGSGRVDCHECHGRGRTNHVQSTVLPKGEWPKWCRSCGGSGLGYCDRCLGTGEYRYIMGFQFMKRDTDHIQDNRAYQMEDRRGSRSFTELLLNEVQLNSSAEN